jgi:FKBP-type peptidyl-prolyl cis-trans isomerase SlyD
MTVAKNRVVSIDYTLTDEKNNIIDSTAGQEPLDYLHGFGNIITGLENALEGKAQGDHFSVNIPAAEAYGERDETLTAEVPIENFRGAGEIKPGMQFHAQGPDGARLVTVAQVKGATVTIDANHPLAGMDLNFDVTVASIRSANEEELTHGHVHGHDSCGCGHSHCGCEGDGGCSGGCGEGCESHG